MCSCFRYEIEESIEKPLLDISENEEEKGKNISRPKMEWTLNVDLPNKNKFSEEAYADTLAKVKILKNKLSNHEKRYRPAM